MEEKPPMGGFSFGVFALQKLQRLRLRGVEPERSGSTAKAQALTTMRPFSFRTAQEYRKRPSLCKTGRRSPGLSWLSQVGIKSLSYIEVIGGYMGKAEKVHILLVKRDNMSDAELARKMGISPQALSREWFKMNDTGEEI
jgi:hypothetical protein